MELNLESLDGLKRKLTIGFQAEEIEGAYQKIVKKQQASTKMPGFRPGKVPVSVLEKRWGEHFQQEAKENLLEQAFKDAEAKFSFIFAYPPEISEDFHSFDMRKKEALSCVASFEVLPQAEPLVEALKKDFSKPSPSLDDNELQEQLEELRLHFSSYQKTEQPIVAKDKLELIIEGEIEGGEKFNPEQEKTVIQLGRKRLEEALEKPLYGKKQGDIVEYSHKFESSFPDPKLQGKSVQFKMHILSVERPEPLEWGEELYQKLAPEIKDQASLETWVKERLIEEKRVAASNKQLEELRDRLRDSLDFDVPLKFIEQNIENFEEKDPYFSALNNAIETAEKEKKTEVAFEAPHQHPHPPDGKIGDDHLTRMSLAEAKQDLAKTKEDYTKNLWKDLRLELYLQSIIQKEKIKAQDYLVYNSLLRLANSFRMQPEELIKSPYGKKIYQDLVLENLQHQALEWNLNQILK